MVESSVGAEETPRSKAVADPQMFGAARITATGQISHEKVYEHRYTPQPVRVYDEEFPAEKCVGLLHPAVRDGKCGFLFWGTNTPETCDHARCWLGQLLLQEAALGRFSAVEYLVTTEKAQVPPNKWFWHVWLADVEDQKARGPGVEVCMLINSEDGVALQLSGGSSEESRVQAFRILRQYCDGEEVDFRPIPLPPGSEQTQKVHRVREIPHHLRHQRLSGKAMPEVPGKAVMARTLADVLQAEERVIGCLADVEARKFGPPNELMSKLMELKEVILEGTTVAKMRMRPAWLCSTASSLEALLESLMKTQHRGHIESALLLCKQLSDLKVPEPANREAAERMVALGA